MVWYSEVISDTDLNMIILPAVEWIFISKFLITFDKKIRTDCSTCDNFKRFFYLKLTIKKASGCLLKINKDGYSGFD